MGQVGEGLVYLTPEAKARLDIDTMLEAAGWVVQDADSVSLSAGQGVAVREFVMASPHGRADYLLFVDQRAVGVLEAKPAGTILSNVEPQRDDYAAGMPDDLEVPIEPLPFTYMSTGTETRFKNGLDPGARTRDIFAVHRPATLVAWADEYYEGTGTLRHRLQHLPDLDTEGLWSAQERAIRNLEESLAEGRPRALIQMATGSGKTYTAANVAYRLVRYGGAKRILFLVDRANLGRQTLNEFQTFTVPNDGRKFTELYNVQHMSSNAIDPVARVTISTIQRLYSTLKGEAELDPAVDEESAYDVLPDEAVPVTYNPKVPPETFDVVIVDECHRSIFGLWRQVLDYFDAFTIGLTATPNKQAFGFFKQNLVMEYGHEEAVTDGVNVDFDVYRIKTQISDVGSSVEAGLFTNFRDRQTRELRWEKLDEEVTYGKEALDRAVVAEDQIRTVIETFRKRLFTEIFPGRTDVPKTLIFAKDDSHADDILRILREEFGKGDLARGPRQPSLARDNCPGDCGGSRGSACGVQRDRHESRQTKGRRMRTTTADIRTLIDKIDRGDIRLPEIQRGYVWKPPKIAGLIDSLYHRYPTGSLLLWETDEDVTERNAAIEGPNAKPMAKPQYLIDGQQRLTSLHRVFNGHDDARIVFNVETERFQRESARTKKDPRWIGVPDVLNEASDVFSLVEELRNRLDTIEPKLIAQRLDRLRKIADYPYWIEILDDLPYEVVADIFVRVNSRGVRLSSVDLALATLSARWRGVIEKLDVEAERWAAVGYPAISVGFLARCIAASAADTASFRVFANAPLEHLQDGWDDTKRGVEHLVQLLKSNAGIATSELLPSENALVPLVAFLGRRPDEPLDAEMADGLLYWLFAAFIQSRYSTSVETVLGQDVAAVRSADPLGGLLRNLRLFGQRLTITEDTLAGRTDRSPYFLLSFLSAKRAGARDWWHGVDLCTDGQSHFKLEYHHIHPRATLKSQYSKAEINDLANLAFISSKANRKISPGEVLSGDR